jgi:hypothetical protein
MLVLYIVKYQSEYTMFLQFILRQSWTVKNNDGFIIIYLSIWYDTAWFPLDGFFGNFSWTVLKNSFAELWNHLQQVFLYVSLSIWKTLTPMNGIL